jgi:deoxyribonuclease V
VISAIDVQYRDVHAATACVVFTDWQATSAVREITGLSETPAPYVPGEFWRRELPCILAILGQLDFLPDLVVVDG